MYGLWSAGEVAHTDEYGDVAVRPRNSAYEIDVYVVKTCPGFGETGQRSFSMSRDFQSLALEAGAGPLVLVKFNEAPHKMLGF